MLDICMTEPDLKIILTEVDARSKVADALVDTSHVFYCIKLTINHFHQYENEKMPSSVRKTTMIKFINLINDSSNHVIEKF